VELLGERPLPQLSASAPRASQRVGALPNLIVIGAMKCGTSALHYYLDLHPRISMSSPKELFFFLDEDDVPPLPDAATERAWETTRRTRRNWGRGIDWYAEHFDSGATVRGESTTAYTDPEYRRVADRMAAVVPNARLIYLARHPIERMISHYLHQRASGMERRDLVEAIVSAPNPYLGRSCYATALAPFLERYPRERILLLRQEDLLSRRRETVRKAFAFLGVDDHWSPKMERLRNRTGGGQRLLGRLARRSELRSLYRLGGEAKWWIERLSKTGWRSPTIALDPGERQRLLAELEPEIAAVERLTSWNLSSWRL
jgi:hypothetical protein